MKDPLHTFLVQNSCYSCTHLSGRGLVFISKSGRKNFALYITVADPGFQVRGGAFKKIAPSGGRREIVLGISCENLRFYANGLHNLPPTPNLQF